MCKKRDLLYMTITSDQFLALKKKKKNKFGAKSCVFGGIKFPSKLEMHCYQYLETMQDCGVVKYIIRQVPFDLPGGTTHKVDFMAVTDKDNVFIEAKGRDLALGKLKRLQVEELYKITISVVTSPLQIKNIL